MVNDMMGVVRLSQTHYDKLKKDGELVVGEDIYKYDPNTTIYITPDTTQEQIDAILERLNGIDRSKMYVDYHTMIESINQLDNLSLIIGQNIYLVTTGVPDLWVAAIEDESVEFDYTSDDEIVNNLEANGVIQVGYYKLGMLETQKADLTNCVKKTDYATYSTPGISRPTNGLEITGSDKDGIGILKATESQIDEGIDNYNPIVSSSVDYAVKKGLTKNAIEWTDAEKNTARQLLGAISDSDFGSDTKGGIFKLGSGLGVWSNTGNQLHTVKATEDDINSKTHNYKVIVPSNLDLAVKKGLIDNKEVWTEEEKTAARSLFGSVSQQDVDDKIADLVGTDAETLETLKELSATIEENSDIVESLNSAIGSKASLESVDLLTERVSEIEQNADGRQIELRATSLYIQWKYVADETWNDLIALSELKGAKGDKGNPGETGNGVAYIKRNSGLLDKATLQGFVGTTRTFSNTSDFNGKVGDFVYLPFSVSDEGGSIGYIILQVSEFTSTSVTGKCMLFIYAPQGAKGDMGDTPDLSGYLPKTGGIMEGDINLSTNRGFNATTTSGNVYDIFRVDSANRRMTVGGSYPALELKGLNARPTYNGSDVALSSDIPKFEYDETTKTLNIITG